MNESVQTIPVRARTKGELAARRCYYPFVSTLLLVAVRILWAVFLRQVDWTGWVFDALWNIPAVLWVLALISLVGAWRDPSSHGFRLEASVVLSFGFPLAATLVFYFDVWAPTFRDVIPFD